MAEKRQRRNSGGGARGARAASGRPADPQARLAELQEELFRLRLQFVTRQLTNTARIRQVRREIARTKTFMRQRELMGEAG